MLDAAPTGRNGSRLLSRDAPASAAPGQDSPGSQNAPGISAVRPRSSGRAQQAPGVPGVYPTWFGPGDRPLFGWWHLPAGRTARAVVVMAPAAARERLSADSTWRQLAVRLSEAGCAVLRFDFSGTGDSAGDGADPGLFDLWLQDVRTAVGAAGSASAAPVIVLGHRLGATLAVEALRAADPQAAGRLYGAVLWDPVVRGRRYLRELTAQQLMAVPSEATGGDTDGDTDTGASGWAEVPGDDLSDETARRIGRLNLLDGRPLPAAHALLLARAGTEATLSPLVTGADGVDIEGIDGQAELLNLDPIDAVPSPEAVGRITAWIDRVAPQTVVPVDPDIRGAVHLHVDPLAAGWDAPVSGAAARLVPVEEQASYRCDGRIFTIESTPATGHSAAVAATPLPTVLLLSAGLEVHTGPGRLWVDLARQWAASGLRVVRCDMPGIGESRVGSSDPDRSVYEASAIDDVEALVRELEPERPDDVVLVGMCSGAYNGLEAAARLGTRRLVTLAFGWWLVPAELRRGQRLDRRRRQYRSGLGLLRLVMAAPAGRRLYAGHPERLWLTGSATGLATPLRPFRRAVRAGTDVAMVMGPSDLRHFTTRPRRFARLRGRSGFTLHEIAGLDHGLLSGTPRRRARREIFRLVLDGLRPQIPREGAR